MTLFEEIQSKCSAEEIAAGNYHVIAAKVNTVDRVKTVSTMISERGILEKYVDGPLAADAVLAKLEAFSVSGHPLASIVKRALKFLANPEGLDIGAPATQGMLSQLGAGGVITADEATKLKALAPTVNDFVNWEECYRVIEAGV